MKLVALNEQEAARLVGLLKESNSFGLTKQLDKNLIQKLSKA